MDEGVFYVVQRSINQDSSVVPRRRLDSDGLVDQRTLTQALVGDRDGCGTSV